ncbi:hypothetical protein DFS34DRAFT_621600, partial [Phlyctochytrium arcticum]
MIRFVNVDPITHCHNATIASTSYGDRLVSNPKFRSLYRFDMSTTAAELKRFHIFGAVPNRMKSAEDLKVLMVDVSKFVKHYKDGVVWIVGDFYVWRNVMKFLWAQSRTPMTQDHKWLKDLLFPWPDGMHIALNAQQALIEHNFAIFMPIWSAAFPGFAVQLVKLRPVRRMMLLTMAFLAWKKNRVAIIALVKNSQKELPPFQQVATQSLVRLFDEELPLVLDAATAMAAGNVSLYKEVMQRLLPVFIRYRKKNYVTIVVHILSVIQDIESRGDPDLLRAFQSKLPLASSEDLEVFHSLLRASIRPHDSESAATLKTLFLSANRNLSARSFLAQVAKQKREDRKRRTPGAHLQGRFSIHSSRRVLTPRDLYYDRHLTIMSAALLSMFQKLVVNSDNIYIHGEMIFSHSASKKKVRGYQVRYKVAPEQSDSESASVGKKRKRANTKIATFMNPAPTIIVTFCERLLPLALWGDKKVSLNLDTDISSFSAIEEKRVPLEDITNNGKTANKKKNDFFTKESVFENPMVGSAHPHAKCSVLDGGICSHLQQHIVEQKFIWWMHNLTIPLDEKDFVREEEEDVEITEEL